MFASLDIIKILTMVSIGLGLFLIALGIFYILYRYRLKNPKEYDEPLDDNILSPYHYRDKKVEKKKNKKLLKTNKILLKEYKRQYNRNEISLEEYQFLTSSLLGEKTKSTNKKETVVEEIMEDNLFNDKLNNLFVEAEITMEEYLKSYHLNTLELVDNIRQKNNILALVNKKKIILNKIQQLSFDNIEMLSEIDGLKENREQLINLVKKELNDISLLEQNLWDDEFCSIYYLESYVYTYIPNLLNEEYYDENEDVDRDYHEIEKEINRNYQEISHNDK